MVFGNYTSEPRHDR